MPRSGVLGHATRIDPAPAEHDALQKFVSHADASAELVLRTSDGVEIAVPPSLLRLLIAVADDLAAGRAVVAIPAEVELTPAEVAELLGRP